MTTYAPTDSKTLEYVFDIIREGVWDWHSDTGYVYRSPGWYRMLGYDVDTLENTVFTWENVIHPDDYAYVMAAFEAYITGKTDRYEAEYRCRKQDGSYLWIRDQGKIVERNPDGTVGRMIGAHLDIHDKKLAEQTLKRQNELLRQDNFNLENIVKQRTAELEQSNKRLESQITQSKHDANTDPLTTLYNRRKFNEELSKEMARSKRYQTNMSMALLDLDFFKEINDTHGHSMGDRVLIELSQIILQNLRSSDVVSRWGGEEFAFIFPETDLDQASVIAEKLRTAIEQMRVNDTISLTVSIGVIQFSDDEDMDNLLQRLDSMLYEAKAQGRNRVVIWPVNQSHC